MRRPGVFWRGRYLTKPDRYVKLIVAYETVVFKTVETGGARMPDKQSEQQVQREQMMLSQPLPKVIEIGRAHV